CKSHSERYAVQSPRPTHAFTRQGTTPSRNLQLVDDKINAYFPAPVSKRSNRSIEAGQPERVGRNVMRLTLLVRVAIVVSLLSVFSFPVQAQSLQDFGYLRMTVNHKPALGVRPLVVVLQNYAGHPALLHSSSYYDNLIFGFGAKNIHDYYAE